MLLKLCPQTLCTVAAICAAAFATAGGVADGCGLASVGPACKLAPPLEAGAPCCCVLGNACCDGTGDGGACCCHTGAVRSEHAMPATRQVRLLDGLLAGREAAALGLLCVWKTVARLRLLPAAANVDLPARRASSLFASSAWRHGGDAALRPSSSCTSFWRSADRCHLHLGRCASSL